MALEMALQQDFGCERITLYGNDSLHETINENGLNLVDFATGRQMPIKSTYFMHERIHL
jgi:hypothetical protein